MCELIVAWKVVFKGAVLRMTALLAKFIEVSRS